VWDQLRDVVAAAQRRLGARLRTILRGERRAPPVRPR